MRGEVMDRLLAKTLNREGELWVPPPPGSRLKIARLEDGWRIEAPPRLTWLMVSLMLFCCPFVALPIFMVVLNLTSDTAAPAPDLFGIIVGTTGLVGVGGGGMYGLYHAVKFARQRFVLETRPGELKIEKLGFLNGRREWKLRFEEVKEFFLSEWIGWRGSAGIFSSKQKVWTNPMMLIELNDESYIAILHSHSEEDIAYVCGLLKVMLGMSGGKALTR